MSAPAEPNPAPSKTVIGSPPSPGSESTQNYDTSSNEPAAEAGPDLRQLLAPAQNEHELGRLGHFRILKKLGAGGMGLVLMAEDISLLRLVALKIMLPGKSDSAQSRGRFLREARAAARIHHDHVVKIHHVDEDRGIPFIAMEFLKGAALDDYLEQKKAVSLAQAMRIGRETAAGLAAAHAEGLIHRDIKPANLWLESPKGRVKILDFGLARDAVESSKLTHSGAVIGTPAYMSPEQAAGATIDHRTDLFSLGIVLYELVTGRLPFNGPHTMALLKALSFDPHPPIPAIQPQASAGLVELIDRLLAKKPDDRPPTAKRVAEILAELSRPAKRSDGELIPDAIELPMDTSFASEAAVGSLPEALPIRDEPERHRWKRRLAIWLSSLALLALIIAGIKSRGERGTLPEKPLEIAAVKEQPIIPVPKVEPEVKKEFLLPPLVLRNELIFDLGDGVKLEMVRINAKGKSFVMGSPIGEEGRNSSKKSKLKTVDSFDQEEQHEIKFDHNYLMGKYEVTQEQYSAIMKFNPSKNRGEGLPVENVSWNDVQEFIKVLNARMGKSKTRFRLSSEAEWEYACRAGTTTAYSFGAMLTPENANFGPGSNGVAKPVGSYKPNSFGLYDMHGNVREYCEDYFGPYSQAPKDGRPQVNPYQAERHVARGGSWTNVEKFCRSAQRVTTSGTASSLGSGFRLAMDAMQMPAEIP